MRALTLALLCCACIERPFEEPQARARPQVDRAALRDVLVPAPPDAVAIGAVFGNAAELVAYKLEPAQMVAGQRAVLTLYWRCRAEMEPWHIFVHLDDTTGAGERIHAEHDPAGGRFPTDAWKPGDSVADSFAFVAPGHPLLLYVGFYSQGENRLPLTNPGRGRDDGTSRLLAGVLPVAR
ncbi:MAG TPA: hypothetical protein VI356_15645 [Myxococcales bacterium]